MSIHRKTKETIFISDLHLSANSPKKTSVFLEFLTGRAIGAHRLYILGDLFDAYIGDDDETNPNREVKSNLSSLCASGTEIFLCHGNRDFLIGDRFFDQTGVKPLSDFTVIDLYGVSALVTHGDLLCTDDVVYQQARKRVRSDDWKRSALSKPLIIRQLFAKWYRVKSRLHKNGKSAEIMDVNAQAVAEALKNHQVQTLIHGHTHRPNHHTFKIDDLGPEYHRFVLPEWFDHPVVLSWFDSGHWAYEGAFN